MAYFSGQGRVYIGARDEVGNPQGLVYVGNVPELKVSLSVETLEHQESTSGQRLTDLQLIVNIGDASSLTRGAEKSHLSLPAASNRVKNLEE